MKIQSLLNPFCGDHRGYRDSESPIPAALPHSGAPYASLPKRQKLPKDAAVFSDSCRIVGFVNYPAHEAGEDEQLAAQHRKFQINPMGEIMRRGARHIPYNSDKKDFLEKTGRDAFEMFQYTYKVPGEDKEYVVVWDYNVGLVRMTPFFKSLKYSKTVPARALKENPGMKDISYSITGGALVCQGYWMPFQAARAIAATFCYNIRWALTPVFGNDFPSICIPPNDPRYAKFLIDRDIVHHCTRETDRFRAEGDSYRVPGAKMPTELCTPRLHFSCPPWGSKETITLYSRASEEESGYCTESDHSDKFLFSPQVSPRSTTWTAVNRSQSPTSPGGVEPPTLSPPRNCLPPLSQVLPTSVPDGFYSAPIRTKRAHSRVAPGCDSIEEYQPSNRKRSPLTGQPIERYIHEQGYHSTKEIDAAEIMMQLSTADRAMPPPKRTRRGSPSC